MIRRQDRIIEIFKDELTSALGAPKMKNGKLAKKKTIIRKDLGSSMSVGKNPMQ